MRGDSDPQAPICYNISLETYVPREHPWGRLRLLVDANAIRKACRSLYSAIGRPATRPEQLFLALVGGYLPGVTSERRLVTEPLCRMTLGWFEGLNLGQEAWNAPTFSQNRRRRFDASGVPENLLDQTSQRPENAS